MPSSGYRKQTVDFGDMALDLQSAAASFTRMSAAAASFVNFVGAFKAFELQIVKVNSAVGGTAQTMKQLSDAARSFALVSKYSAGEAASSMVMLAQAGFSAEEAMAAMPSVLQLAQASMENLDLVADTVASTIRTYGLNAQEATRVTNLFAASAVNSLATVNKLAFSFRQVGPVAAELGLSVEETAAALDILYNRGLRGEQAGTALRNILIRLIKPTKDTYETFYRLGIALNDSNGQLRNYQDILRDLGTKRVSDTALTKMFGREALAGAKTLIAATTGEYQKMLETITDTNTAARMANAQMNTMDGSLSLIKNSLTELGIVIGESVGPLVKNIAGVVQDLAISLRTADKETISSIKHFAQFAGGLYLAEKAAKDLYSKLIPMATAINKTFQGGVLNNIMSFINSVSPNGELTQGNFLKLWSVGQWGGSDWYKNMAEAYKEMTKGGKLSVVAAAQIKNMGEAEAFAAASSMKLSFGLKAVWASVKALGLAFAKLLPVMAVAWAGFKLYDNWAKEQERRAQLKEDLFPELTQIKDKLKEVKLAVNRDLPDIVTAYKANMEALQGARRTAGSAADFFANYGFTTENMQAYLDNGMYPRDVVENIYYEKVKKFGDILTDAAIKGQKLTAAEFFAAGRKVGLENNVLNEFFDGYNSVLKSVEGAIRDEEYSDVYLFMQSYVRKHAERVLSVMETSTKEVLEDEKQALANIDKLVQQQIGDAIATISRGRNNLIKDYITKQDLNEKTNKELGRAWAALLLGLPMGEDPEGFFNDPKTIEEAKKRLMLMQKLGTEKVLNIFRNSKELFNSLSPEAQSVIKTSVDVDVNGDLKLNALDLTKQELIVTQLKKQYADLVSDYKLSWEVLTQEQFAAEKIAKLQREIQVNNESIKSTIDKIYYDIFTKLGRKDEKGNVLFDEEAAKEALNYIDSATGKILNKEQLLASLGTIKDKTQRDYVKSKLDELELQTQIAVQKNKELEQEKKHYDLVEGRLANIKKYKDYLDKLIQQRDDKASRDNTIENLKEGIGTGVIELEKQVDSFYEMGKKGMQGFADYLTDSMNNVVDAWGKGWGAMRDALKNTLADMLKELSHYFMKQAMYGLASQMGGSLFGPVTVSNTPFGSLTGGTRLLPGEVAPWEAKGGIWDKGLQTFATGGVVTSPILFNHKGGKGLMGEAGPEAIMPLRRDSQGRLGVSVAGGSTLNYAPSFNINMTTGQMDTETSQRNTNRMTKELDSKVKNAVLLVLAKEKRPGGLLYGR